MNSCWHKGLPKDKGIYWFDSGLNKKFEYKMVIPPFLLRVGDGGITTGHLYGAEGSDMPLSMALLPESTKIIPHYANIEPPNNWQNLSIIKKKYSYGWVKHPKGYTGVANLQPGWHSNVHGVWLWLDHPHSASESGAYYKFDEGFLFSPVKVPFRP